MILDRGHKLATLDIDALARAIREADAWTPHRARTVDRELRSRVVDALRSRASAEDVSATQDRLQRSVNLARGALAAVEGDWAVRWSGILDVLSLRLEQLSRRDTSAVLRRAHVASILGHLQRAGAGGAKQADIAAAIGQSPQAVSRLLPVIEDHGLVERTSAGRENRVMITNEGSRLWAQSTAQPDDAASPEPQATAEPESLDALADFDVEARVNEAAASALENHFRRDGTPVSKPHSPRVNAAVTSTGTPRPTLPSQEGYQRAAAPLEGALDKHPRDGQPTGRPEGQHCDAARERSSAEDEPGLDAWKSTSKFPPAPSALI